MQQVKCPGFAVISGYVDAVGRGSYAAVPRVFLQTYVSHKGVRTNAAHAEPGAATLHVDTEPFMHQLGHFWLEDFSFFQLLGLNKVAWPFVTHLSTPNAIN